MTKYIQELQRRIPVWQSISDLFLDTEITDQRIERIVQRCVESNYSVKELNYIFRYEVAPIVWRNLMAGEWAGFNQDWLKDNILKRLKGKITFNHTSLLGQFIAIYRTRLVKDDWQRVLNNLNAKNK